tara:strand:- start:656 stop:1051 length:396 start_codon:yes stop_codon:yes gene_type:complete
MKAIIPLIFVFFLFISPVAIACSGFGEIQCRRSSDCTPLYGEHFLIFNYNYEGCMDGTPEKIDYFNQISGSVSLFFDNFKGVTTAATVDDEAEEEEEEEQEDIEIQEFISGKEKTVYIYAGSKLLAKVKDV